MTFRTADPDLGLSPCTGLTRRHWLRSAELLLEGVLGHVKNGDAPPVFPRRSEIAYPRPDAPWFAHRAQEAEGLARTFMVAAPMLAETPDLDIRGIQVRDYYAKQILRACDPASPCFWGRAADVARANGGQPGQQLVEAAALCIGLMSCRRQIWDRYSPGEKDQVAACLRDYVHAETHPHNWRFFNVLIGAFLQVQGHAVDDALFNGHLRALMAWYAGDGWYRDGGQFDYYSPWAFQFYGPIWCDWIGYERQPELAAIIERRHGELMRTYPYFFGRGGESLLWGRSAVYRCAASAPLVTAFRLRHTPLDPGWARRLASGNLLQFIGRDDLWQDGIPSLGFYGPADAVLQGYNCAASPFWLAKIYQALVLPADSPFWTATENDGVWPALGGGARTVVLDGPGLAGTLHGPTATAECRPGKVTLAQPLYQRLVFNTAFPWEDHDPEGGVAMAYTLRRPGRDETFVAPTSMLYGGMKDGVLYRKIIFDTGGFSPGPAAIDLAEIILPGGVLRIDRVRIPGDYELHLGHFGMPHQTGRQPEIVEVADDIFKGLAASVPGRGLLLGLNRGWAGWHSRVHRGRNAEAETSTVIHAFRRGAASSTECDLLITLMLHRTDDASWAGLAWNPVESVVCHDWSPSGSPGGATVTLKGLGVRSVDFANLEGCLGA